LFEEKILKKVYECEMKFDPKKQILLMEKLSSKTCFIRFKKIFSFQNANVFDVHASFFSILFQFK